MRTAPQSREFGAAGAWIAALHRGCMAADGTAGPTNLDRETVEGFGYEWTRVDQSRLSDAERRQGFQQYFAVFVGRAAGGAVGFDLGCGTGPWALEVAPRVGTLH